VNSSGKVERTFRYGPYGENVKSDGTQTIPYPFGYKGGYRMPGGNKGQGNVTNGLYHYGQRYYDPTTGRWTQPDPLGHVGSATQGDRFLFAGSDPINLSDPRGENVAATGAVAVGTCGAAIVSSGAAAVFTGVACAGSSYQLYEEVSGPIEEFGEEIGEL
jgi:RHS repeat-associated protein